MPFWEMWTEQQRWGAGAQQHLHAAAGKVAVEVGRAAAAVVRERERAAELLLSAADAEDLD